MGSNAGEYWTRKGYMWGAKFISEALGEERLNDFINWRIQCGPTVEGWYIRAPTEIDKLVAQYKQELQPIIEKRYHYPFRRDYAKALDSDITNDHVHEWAHRVKIMAF